MQTTLKIRKPNLRNAEQTLDKPLTKFNLLLILNTEPAYRTQQIF